MPLLALKNKPFFDIKPYLVVVYVYALHVHVDGHLQRVVARRQHREGDVSRGT